MNPIEYFVAITQQISDKTEQMFKLEIGNIALNGVALIVSGLSLAGIAYLIWKNGKDN